MKRLHKRGFTLIELLVSMAVFSILLVISMRLFSGAQRLWLRSEQKTNAFADARVSMEFLAARIQSLYYTDEVPFYIYDKRSDTAGFSNNCSEAWFASKMPLGNEAANRLVGLRFIRFYLADPAATDVSGAANAGKLQMQVYSGGGLDDKDLSGNKIGRNKWAYIFPPYGEGNKYFTTADAAFNEVKDAWSLASREKDVFDIIENVVDFKLSWHNAKPAASGWDFVKPAGAPPYERKQKTPPYVVEVEISLLDSRENFLKWRNPPAGVTRDEIFAEYGYTFRRAVLTGKRLGE